MPVHDLGGAVLFLGEHDGNKPRRHLFVSTAFDTNPFSLHCMCLPGAALVTVLPDDSVAGIALETFVAFPLLFVIPAVCAVGGFALTGLK